MNQFYKHLPISVLLKIGLVACASKTIPTSMPVQPNQVPQATLPSPTATLPKVHLKVGIQSFFAYGPFFIAQDRGYFAEQGLDVEFVNFNNTADSIPALLQGQLDVMSGLLTVNTLSAIAQGGNIKYVADRGYLDPAICSGNAFVARKGLVDSGELNDLSNLAGKKISTTKNTIAEYALDMLLQKAMNEARQLISGLRPPILEEMGVISAISYLIDNLPANKLTIHFSAKVQFERLEPLLEATIYRIVQQAINNIQLHSRADRAEIRLTQQGDWIHLKIQDWGIGFDPSNVSEDRFGLQGIRERARLMRGRAAIDSAPGKGTQINVDLPVT